jgi:hypothetical protein
VQRREVACAVAQRRERDAVGQRAVRETVGRSTMATPPGGSRRLCALRLAACYSERLSSRSRGAAVIIPGAVLSAAASSGIGTGPRLPRQLPDVASVLTTDRSMPCIHGWCSCARPVVSKHLSLAVRGSTVDFRALPTQRRHLGASRDARVPSHSTLTTPQEQRCDAALSFASARAAHSPPWVCSACVYVLNLLSGSAAGRSRRDPLR